MPYYIYCTLCENDGKYLGIKPKCGRCDGTGRDWRGDYELAGYHSWAGIDIADLKKNQAMSSVEGVEFFYRKKVLTKSEDLKEIDRIRTTDIERQLVYSEFRDVCIACSLGKCGCKNETCDCEWCQKYGTGLYDENKIEILTVPFGEHATYPFYFYPSDSREYYDGKEHLEYFDGYVTCHPEQLYQFEKINLVKI